SNQSQFKQTRHTISEIQKFHQFQFRLKNTTQAPSNVDIIFCPPPPFFVTLICKFQSLLRRKRSKSYTRSCPTQQPHNSSKKSFHTRLFHQNNKPQNLSKNHTNTT